MPLRRPCRPRPGRARATMIPCLCLCLCLCLRLRGALFLDRMCSTLGSLK